jgi:hypothetical protein
MLTRGAMHTAALSLVALAFVAPGASAADRNVEVTPAAPATWDGASATGANVTYDTDDGGPCGKTPANYCDTTLVNVNVGSDFWATRGGGVQFSLDNYRPNRGSDFDMFIYRSDAEGNRGPLVGSSADVPGAPEQFTVKEGSGYYLVHVVYFAVTQSTYTGEVKFVTRERFPPDVDDPRGFQDRLASNPALGYRSHSEPHIARSPTEPNMLIAASKQYNLDRDSLKEYEFKIGTYVSFDGGRNWRDLGPTNVCHRDQAPPSSWPNNTCYPADDPNLGGTTAEDVKDPQGEAGQPDPFDERGSGDYGEEYIVSDPWVEFDDEGNAYLMVLDAPPFSSGNGWGMSFHRWESPTPEDVETGATWSNRIPINKYDDPVRQAEFLDDKNTFAVNNAGPEGDGQIGTIVACWGQNIDPLIKQQTVCERSTDGGQNWPGQPVPISDGQQLVIGVHVIADHNAPNTFYAFWFEYAQELAGAPGTFRFSRTTDGGVTWSPSIPVVAFHSIPRTFPGQAFRNLSLPIAAQAPNGDLYMTYADYVATPQGAQDEDGMHADIRIVKSTNGGLGWSPPRTVNTDGGRADQFQQYVRVTPGGQVNVAYFDRRHDPENFFIDSYLSRSDDGGQTFTDTRITHDMWDPTINPPLSPSGEFIGDYQGLVADDCEAVWFANDTHLALNRDRDPNFDEGLPRSEFQEVFSWHVPGAAAETPACRAERAGLGRIGGRFVISRRAVKLTRRGIARVRVSCRTILRCRGRLRLHTARRVRRSGGRRRRVHLGTRRFNIPSRSRNRILRVRLSPSDRRLIARRRRTRVLARARVTMGDPPLTGIARRRFFLYRPSGLSRR